MSEVLTSRRTLRILDAGGHASFGWDPEDDEWVIPMIQKKMDEGYVFWIIRRNNPLREVREVRLERVEDVRESRHVIIRDNDARVLFEQGHIGLLADTDEDIEVGRAAQTAEEAAANDTVAHRPFAGG